MSLSLVSRGKLRLRLLERLLGILLRGDVGIGADHPDRPPVLAIDDGAARQEPADAAIPMHHPVRDLERRDSPIDVCLGRRHHPFAVIGMHAQAPVVEVVGDFVIREAEDVLERWIDVDRIGDEIPVPDAYRLPAIVARP